MKGAFGDGVPDQTEKHLQPGGPADEKVVIKGRYLTN
jgi:hypothetical protein